MTTIAWDGKTLAGDTLCCRGDMKNYVESKVFVLKTPSGEVLFGGSGDYQDVQLVGRWIEAGMPEDKKPTLGENALTAILVMAGVAYRIESKLMLQRLMEPFHAVGSGRDWAMAAMHLGRTAREAVELASHYDVSTGGKITALAAERAEKPNNVVLIDSVA